jgi:acyl carrier protein
LTAADFGSAQRKNKGDIMDKLLEILSSLHPDVDFETAEDLVDDGILDSLDIVTIVTEINSEFDVAIPAEEIIPENFNSAAALMELIERLDEE